MNNKSKHTAIFVITEYNHRDITEKCVASIPKHHNIFIGNDGFADLFGKRIDKANVIDWPDNVRYVKNANRTAQVATGYMGPEQVVIISNNDMIYTEESIDILVSYILENSPCIVGPTLIMPRIFVPDGGKGTHIQHYDINGLHLRPKEPVNITALSGCCLAMKIGVWRSLGGYDRRFIDYSSDNDICMRAIKKGFKVQFLPDAIVTHLAGRSYTDGHLPEREAFLKRDQQMLKAIHPNSQWNPTGIFPI